MRFNEEGIRDRPTGPSEGRIASVRQLRGQNSVNLILHPADLRIWGAVALIGVLGVGTALVPYYVGRRGIEVVLTRFLRLKEEHLGRVQIPYQGHGSGLLLFSFVPMLGVLLTARADVIGAASLHAVLKGWAESQVS
jgi:membrane protein YqaA with SNARE-associated domain